VTRTVSINLKGMDCIDCANKLQKALANQDGILNVSLNFSSGRGTIEFDTNKLNLIKIEGIVSNHGYKMVGEVIKYSLDDIHCRDCGRELENHLESKLGVIDASVAFGSKTISANFVPSEIKRAKLEKAIEGMGYKIIETEEDLDVGKKRQKIKAILLAVSAALFITGLILNWFGVVPSLFTRTYNWLVVDLTLPNILFLAALVIPGAGIAKEGYYSLKGRVLTIDVLVIIAASGAVLIGTYWEGAAVIFLTAFGELLQDVTMERTRRALADLLGSSPKTAQVRRNGEIVEIDISEIIKGDVCIVKPGEKIPADGKVIKGVASVNQAPITGESVPVCKEPGSEVFGGTLNEDGYLELEVERAGDDTTISRILRLVQDAQEEKAPAQQFIEKFAEYFVPMVIILSIVSFIITRNVTSALTLLVVACPCALVISTPVAVVAGLGNAANQGVLIKGGVSLETLGQVKTVLFDKTGTLSRGEHEISRITGFDESEDEILRLAALAEQKSEHPISKAILHEAKDRHIELKEPDEFEVHRGKGVTARFGTDHITVGNGKLLAARNISIEDSAKQQTARMENDALTVFYVVKNSEIKGLIGTQDAERLGAKQLIRNLKEKGIRTVMVSGDNQMTVNVIGSRLALDAQYGSLLPEDKVKVIKQHMEKGKTAMVGDGINDAPALATADVGIAMGGTGSDLAIETSDVTLLSGDITKINDAIRLSRKTLAIIKQNTAFAMFVVIGLILSALVGWIGLAFGVIGHEASALIVIGNSMRLLKRKSKEPHGHAPHQCVPHEHEGHDHAEDHCNCEH